MTDAGFDERARRGDAELETLRARLAAARGTTREAELERELRVRTCDELRWRVEARPDDPDLRLRLGEALFALEDWSAAIEQLQKARDSAWRAEACYRLGLAFRRLGIPTLALKELTASRQATASDSPLAAQVDRAIADVLAASGRGPDAGPGSLARLRPGDPPGPPRPEREQRTR